MRILLLGSNGMLGQAIRKQFISSEIELIGVDRANSDFSFDLTDDNHLWKCFNQIRPDIVINTAALVSIDGCENDCANAYRINGRLPGILADLCNTYSSYFIHISTDQFYTGDMNIKHKESCPISLINEYARTKYIGECLALTYADTLILRTNIVGFRQTKNKPTFIEWVINSLKNKEKLTLFNDFFTSSIHTNDFAKILKDVIAFHPTGVFNLASSEVSSKKDFILALGSKFFEDEIYYQEDSVANIQGTRRGDSLGLDTSKLEDLVGYKMPNLNETINSIEKEYLQRFL